MKRSEMVKIMVDEFGRFVDPEEDWVSDAAWHILKRIEKAGMCPPPTTRMAKATTETLKGFKWEDENEEK